jgi:hypothetical protein
MTDREELVRRAAELVPVLKERAAQPVRFGGLGLNFDVVCDVAAELGRGCGSTAWCYSIWASHNWLAGMFPQRAQEEYWADSPNTLPLLPSIHLGQGDCHGGRISGLRQVGLLQRL